MCFRNPLDREIYTLPRKNSEDESQPKVSGHFAMQMIEFEIQLEQNCTIELVQKLTELYTQAIEFFDDNDDSKYNDIQVRLHRMLSRPEVIAILNSPEKVSEKVQSSSYEQKKTVFETRKKDMAVRLNENLNPKLAHSLSTSELISSHSNKIQKIATQISNSLTTQEKNLEDRVFQRKKSMISHRNNTSLTNIKFVGECDMSGGCDKEILMQKEIEEFLEENFSLQTTAVSEVNVKYETEIKQFEGQGGVMAMVVEEMRKNKEAEVLEIKNYYEKIRRDQIMIIKKRYLSS